MTKAQKEAREVARRVARLKCVVFLTEHPDVKKYFRIVPRKQKDNES